MQLITKKSLALFILLSFSFSWGLFILVDYILVPPLILSQNNNQATLYLIIGHYLAMLGPGIASIIMIKYYHGEKLPSLIWSKLKFYMYGALFMIAVWGIPTIIGLFVDLGFTSIELNPVVILYIIAPFTILWISGMGEEMGWCVYLLPRLAPKTGQMRAMVISGTIRGIWHLPLILVPFIAYENVSVFMILIFTVIFGVQLAISNIFFGFIFGWIWFETQSLPLLGWVHQWYDLVRDLLLLFILGLFESIWFSSSTILFTLLALYPALVISKKEGSDNWTLIPTIQNF